MVLGRSVNKCVLCPQRYNCGTYVTQMISGVNNYQVNNANKIEDQSIIRSINKSTKENVSDNQQITALFSSIEENLNKTNQELSNQNMLLKQEIEHIKEELDSIKSQSKSYQVPNLDLDVEILSNDQINEETGLELYNKNNSTILREKKTIFGTKKWVEEKK